MQKDNRMADEVRPLVPERSDIPFEKDIRTRMEHMWRYRFASKRFRGKVLDVGCGTGYGSRFLHDLGNEVSSIDVSEDAIGHARKNYAGPEYIKSSAENIPFPDEIFDAITAFEVIEHVPDPYKALLEMHRVLKSGGSLFISTPNPRNLRNIMKYILFGIPYPDRIDMTNPYHLKEFYYDEFMKVLKDSGFIVKAKYGQTVPKIPVFYSINLDFGRFLPRFAWTVVVHAVKGERRG